MPRTALTVNDLPFSTITQLTTETADAANDHAFVNDGRTIIVVYNGGVGAVEVTVVEQAEPRFGRSNATGTQQSVAAGALAIIGPLDPAGYNIKSGADAGKVYIDLDSDTSVELAAYRLHR